jgi:hypothetical protein
MKLSKNTLIVFAAGALWLALIGAGLGALWRYESTPGITAAAPVRWPAASRIKPDPNRATLVMLAHPRCPCTRASIGELARLMTQARGRVTAYVLFVKPAGFSDEWVQSDLWASAAAIPGVTPVLDDGGAEAGLFRAETSGQTVLYDASGSLLFSGGITASRGHAGDNLGRSAIVALLGGSRDPSTETPVFGCSLFNAKSQCAEGANQCEK